MTTTYKGRPLNIGDTLPGTSLTFVGTILPRRGKFQCVCGRTIALNMSAVEHGDRRSCENRCHRKGCAGDERDC